MGMGFGSNKMRRSATATVLCVVLGLALFFVEAAAKDSEYCRRKCRHREDWSYCYRQCIFSSGDGAAMRLAAHSGAGEEAEARGSGGRVGGQAGLLAMPTEHAGWVEAEKNKKADAAPGQLGYDPEFCSFMCRYIHEKEDCLRKCEAAGGKEATP